MEPKSKLLLAYLKLEAAMLLIEELGDGSAENKTTHDEMLGLVEDAMDPLWYSLSDEERKWLNSRTPDATGGMP